MGANIRKKLFWQRPSLIFFVTGRCNGRCLHCFAHDLETENEMSPEEVRDFALQMGQLDDLSISGGEPLLRKDIGELLDPLFEIGKPKTCTFPTGGLEPELAKKICSELATAHPDTRLTVVLPLEGDRELHDEIRGIKGAFDKLCETYELLKHDAEAGLYDLKINTTISSLNQDAIERVIEVEKERFPKAVFHHFEFMRGEGRSPKVGSPDPEAVDRIKEAIYAHWSGFSQFYKLANKMAIAAKKEVFEIELEVLRGKRLPFTCRAHEMGLVLYPTGDVAFCELTPIIGNIRLNTIEKILAGPQAKVAKIDITHGCSCTHSCFIPKSLLASPKEIADVLGAAASQLSGQEKS